MRKLSRLMLVSASLLTLAVVPMQTFAVAPETQLKPPRQDYNAGAYLYRTFCASCHGEGGVGNGPVASLLRTRPRDLTTLATQSGGQFNRPEVYTAIDGRRRVPGHGPADMPIWGDVLKVTEGHDDAIIKKRIDALAVHLESLQRK